MSKRRDIAEAIEKHASAVGISSGPLTGVFPPDQERGTNYYSILFSMPRILDGSIRVYGPSFITVWYRTSIRDLPHSEKATLRSLEQVKSFLTERFGKYAKVEAA